MSHDFVVPQQFVDFLIARQLLLANGGQVKTLLQGEKTATDRDVFAAKIAAMIKRGESADSILACFRDTAYDPKTFVNDSIQRYMLVHWASRYAHLELLRRCKDLGCDFKAITGSQSNALHYASSAPVYEFLMNETDCTQDARCISGLVASECFPKRPSEETLALFKQQVMMPALASVSQ